MSLLRKGMAALHQLPTQTLASLLKFRDSERLALLRQSDSHQAHFRSNHPFRSAFTCHSNILSLTPAWERCSFSSEVSLRTASKIACGQRREALCDGSVREISRDSRRRWC